MRDAVNQRQIGVAQQSFIRGITDALHKRVGIVTGAGDHSQNAAVARVFHHHCRPLPFKHRFDILLQRQIERQVNVFARLWRLFFQQAYHATVVIHFDFLITGGAMQL
ncbi:hypothetical protein D3C80_1123630 [compost metagenome]